MGPFHAAVDLLEVFYELRGGLEALDLVIFVYIGL
jgi:hypothetical protein